MAPHSKEKKSKNKLSAEIRITIDSVEYVFSPQLATNKDRLQLWHESKLTLPEVIDALDNGKVETFFIAALVFLARRQMHKPASFESISESITFDSELTVVLDEGGDSPKAQESDTQPS